MIETIGRSKSTTLMLVCLHALPALTVSIVREEGGTSDAGPKYECTTYARTYGRVME